MIETYGQASQDIFALYILNHKKNGYFVEIGSGHPYEANNTYTMEKNFGWLGIMIEQNPHYETRYKQFRNSKYVINDASIINYKDLFIKMNVPKEIDYLQIDLDVDNRSTLTTLELLDKQIFNEYKFATVTFEHDIYHGDYFNTRQKSREIFESNGYILVFPDVRITVADIINQPFEDWYIHPNLVNIELINKLKTDESLNHVDIFKILKTICGGEYEYKFKYF